MSLNIEIVLEPNSSTKNNMLESQNYFYYLVEGSCYNLWPDDLLIYNVMLPPIREQ